MTCLKVFVYFRRKCYSCFHDKEISIKITYNMHLHASYILYMYTFFLKIGFRDISNENKFYLNNRSNQQK